MRRCSPKRAPLAEDTEEETLPFVLRLFNDDTPRVTYLFSVAVPPSEHRVLLCEGAPAAHFFDHPVRRRACAATRVSVCVRDRAATVQGDLHVADDLDARHPGLPAEPEAEKA